MLDWYLLRKKFTIRRASVRVQTAEEGTRPLQSSHSVLLETK